MSDIQVLSQMKYLRNISPKFAQMHHNGIVGAAAISGITLGTTTDAASQIFGGKHGD
jgi:hypothetical protein